jgi:hypothetical protein
MPLDSRIERLTDTFTLERVLVLSAAVMLAGVVLLLVAVNHWRAEGFGPLDYADTMRLVVPGVTLTAVGFQTVLSAFFISVLALDRR